MFATNLVNDGIIWENWSFTDERRNFLGRGEEARQEDTAGNRRNMLKI